MWSPLCCDSVRLAYCLDFCAQRGKLHSNILPGPNSVGSLRSPLISAQSVCGSKHVGLGGGGGQSDARIEVILYHSLMGAVPYNTAEEREGLLVYSSLQICGTDTYHPAAVLENGRRRYYLTQQP